MAPGLPLVTLVVETICGAYIVSHVLRKDLLLLSGRSPFSMNSDGKFPILRGGELGKRDSHD